MQAEHHADLVVKANGATFGQSSVAQSCTEFSIVRRFSELGAVAEHLAAIYTGAWRLDGRNPTPWPGPTELAACRAFEPS